MADNGTDATWWRPIPGSCVLTVENIPTVTGNMMYYLEAHNRLGERHRFLSEGVYWLGQDVRVFRDGPPSVGRWESVPAPGEVDLADLGKLLDDGAPSANPPETGDCKGNCGAPGCESWGCLS